MPLSNDEHGQMIEEMKNQLLIVLMNRLGGDLTIPVNEINDTGQFLVSMEVDQIKGNFHFTVSKKS